MTPRALPDDGNERYTTRRIVFAHPFTLGSEPDIYPAGVYDVETKEHAVDAGGHVGHVRSSTMLIIPTPSGTQWRQVQSSDLDEAISRDAEKGLQRDPSENPDRGDADGAGNSDLPQ